MSEATTLHRALMPHYAGASASKRVILEGAVQVNFSTVKDLDYPVRQGDIIMVGKRWSITL